MKADSAAYPEKRFWNWIAARYSKQPISDEASYQRKLAVTREYFTPDSEVLELGCGTGSTAILHAPHVKHIQAIDISSKMIEIAKGKAEAEGIGNVTFTRSPIDTFEAPPESFDVVLGLSILHLLPDKEAVIAGVHEMLRPGGVFVTSTACLGDSLKFRLIGLVLPVGTALGLLPMVKFFTARELLKSLTDAGFEIDHEWRPGRNKAVFIVARKSG